MERYLITHSLLSSWLYSMKSNSYEDATTDRDAFAEFLQVLRREPTPTTEAMHNGIDFEDLVTAIVQNDSAGMQRNPEWFSAAKKIADIVGGGSLQHRARKTVVISGMTFVLYGRLDVLKAGIIYDIKFSKSYERGKFYDSTQHPMYLDIVPEATRFIYLISDGKTVFHEEYRRDEAADIEQIVKSFISWLTENKLLDIFRQYWVAL